jgi:hypothetical protein
MVSTLRNGNSKGSKYSPETKEFMAVLMLSSGMKSGGYLANIVDMSKRTAQRLKSKKVSEIPFEEGLSKENIRLVLRRLQKEKVKEGISEWTLMELSWDETPCIEGLKECIVDGKIMIMGFCGKKRGLTAGKGCNFHQCFSTSIEVKHTEDLEALLEDWCFANNVSLLMLNPLNGLPGCKSMKPRPVFCLPTCMCFTKEQILELIKSIL